MLSGESLSLLSASLTVSLLTLVLTLLSLFPTSVRCSVVNGGFETGTAGAAPGAPWIVQSYLNTGVTIQNPQTLAGLNLAPVSGGVTGVPKTVILNAPGGAFSQVDAVLGAAASLRWPFYDFNSVAVNLAEANKNVNTLTQTYTVSSSDVDPVDDQIHVRFVYAAVLQNPSHAPSQNPYAFIQLTSLTRGLMLSTTSLTVNSLGKSINPSTANMISYDDWRVFDYAAGPMQAAQGDQLVLEFVAAGCSLGSHYGYIYVDGIGAVLPGLFLSSSVPSSVSIGSAFSFALTLRNGASSATSVFTGAMVTFTLPAYVTFLSLTPFPGSTCTTPAVGATGTVACTFSAPISAGTIVSASVNLAAVNDVTKVGTQIVFSQYASSWQGAPQLLGPIQTATLVSANPALIINNFGSSSYGTASISISITSVAGFPTSIGTLSFTSNAVPLTCSPYSASAQSNVLTATCGLGTSLNVGTYTITASYPGDAFNLPAQTSSILVLSAAPTTVTLTSSAPTTFVHVPLTFTVSVSSFQSLTGQVLIQNIAVTPPISLFTVEFVNGVGHITTVAPAASYSLVAVYLGSPNFLASTSSPIQQTVNAQVTSLSLSSTSVFWPQLVILTANLTLGDASLNFSATGIITFTIDDSLPTCIATLPLLTCSFSNAAPGSHTIVATYSGDAFYLSSSSSPVSLVVAQDVTSLSITTTNTPSAFGDVVTFTAVVTVTNPIPPNLSGGAPVATGVVTFTDLTSGAVLCNAVPLVNLTTAAKAVCTTSAVSVGAHSVQAQYTGSVYDLPVANTVGQTVEYNTRVTVSSSLPISNFGDTVVFTATVVDLPINVPSQGGVISFSASTVPIADCQNLVLVNGKATCSTSSLAASTTTTTPNNSSSYVITASYSGSTVEFASSAKINQIVNQVPTSTILSSSFFGGSVFVNAPVTFAATVVTNSSAPIPVGNVVFNLGFTTLSAVINNAGVATVTITTTPAQIGQYSVSATYPGSANFGASSSSAISLTIIQPTPAPTPTPTPSSSTSPSINFVQFLQFIWNSVGCTTPVPTSLQAYWLSLPSSSPSSFSSSSSSSTSAWLTLASITALTSNMTAYATANTPYYNAICFLSSTVPPASSSPSSPVSTSNPTFTVSTTAPSSSTSSPTTTTTTTTAAAAAASTPSACLSSTAPSLLSVSCVQSIWNSVGCTSTYPSSALSYWKSLSTVSAVSADMSYYFHANTVYYNSICFGTATRPTSTTVAPIVTTTPPSSTAQPACSSVPSLLTSKCLQALWLSVGCTTSYPTGSHSYWLGLSTIGQITTDMSYYASSTASYYKLTCMGTR